MKRFNLALFVSFSMLALTHLNAFGTYSEGWSVVVPTKLEQSGIIFDSYEGMYDVVTFDRNDKNDKCDEKENLCFPPKSRSVAFSIRPENARAVNFIQKNIGREMLIQYRVHRITAMALSSELEILDAKPIDPQVGKDVKRQVAVQKSGAKRAFSLYGKILLFEYRGRAIGTYEGIYYDKQRDRVHPFSVANEEMAKFIPTAMSSSTPFYFGVSVAYVTAWRESDYDVYEINYDSPAGAAKVEPAPQEPEKKSEAKDDKPTEPAK